MTKHFLRQMALRCLAIAGECSDEAVKAKLYDLSEELLRKANEIEGTTPPPIALPPLNR